MYNNKNIHAHNGRIQDTSLLHSNDEFAGCNLNSGNTPTSVKQPVPPKQSTTSVLRQWRRPDAADTGPKHVPPPDVKYSKVPQSGPDSDRPLNPAYPSALLDNPAEYSMYNQHSAAVPPNRQYLAHVQYGGDSTGYSRASPLKQVPDSVVKYSSAGQQYYAQDSTGDVHYRGANFPGRSTPPVAHSANAKSGYANAEAHNYAPMSQKLSPNYHYPMVSQVYHQKHQQNEPKSTSQQISDEQNSYCLKSGTYPVQNRVPQHGPAPSGHPNTPYPIQNQLERRLSPQEPAQPYYANKSACLTHEMRPARHSYAVDKPGGYPNAYGQSYVAQKPGLTSPQELKSREYRQLVQSPTKKSPPFPILEQRLCAEGSFYPEYGPGVYPHYKYGPGMVPGCTQKIPRDSYLNTSGPKFPPEDIIPSSYAKYYAQNKVTYEPNHYLLQMNQMQSRLNPNPFSRSTELPRDVAYMDQTPRGLPKSRVQYNAMDASQYGPKSSNVATQKPTKIGSYSNLQDQRLADHPSGEYFRNYPTLAKQQSVIQSSKMSIDSYNMSGRSEPGHEQQSYAYSPPLIHQTNRPALAQYPTNYRPSPKSSEVSSGNISPRRTFQENMPVVVIPPQCIGLPKLSPPQFTLPGQDYPQMYPNYLPKDSYYPGSNVKTGHVQYPSDQLLKKQPVQASRNVHVQSSRTLPSYPGPQYHQSSPDQLEKVYYPGRPMYSQQVVQATNPSFQGAYTGPVYRGYEALGDAAGVVRAAYGKKEVDIGKSLKEYLESWEDDEDIVTNLPDVVLCNNIPAEKQKHVAISEAKSMSSAEDEPSPQPLYILDSTNISSEALSQYLHIQQIDRLPANIKGYYKIPGVAAALEIPESSSRLAADKKSQNSSKHVLKSTAAKSDLQTRPSAESKRVTETAESPASKPQIQAAKSDVPHTAVVSAQDYSKRRELNILEVTELRIPEISAELAETAAENASPQDYSVNKRAAAEVSLSAGVKMPETSEESRFQNCLPQDFSITRKSGAETTFQGAEKISDAAAVSRPVLAQDYSISKQIGQARMLQAEVGQLAAPENATEASVIHPNTPEDYSVSVQEDVALNLSTNRTKFEGNSEETHSLQESLREDALFLEADSSIIEDTTKKSSASKLQDAMLQGSNEKPVERANQLEEDKVSSSNTRNLHPELYAHKFSSKLNEDSLDEASAVVEEYMKIQHEELHKSDTKLEIAKAPAVIQTHTASVIVQNTFFDDKSSSKTLLDPLKQPSVPSSIPMIVQKSNEERENTRSCSPNLQTSKTCIDLRSDCHQQPTNRLSPNKADHNVEAIAQICSEGITTVAEDESSTYSSLQSSRMSPVPSDPPRSVHAASLQNDSSVFGSFSAEKLSYESSEHSDVEKEVKQCRKKSLLDDYKRKLDESSSDLLSSECSDDEDGYTGQRAENKDESNERRLDRCSGIETGDSEGGDSFASDNSGGEEMEFDQERAEESATEEGTTRGTAEANTNRYRNKRSSRDEAAREEEPGQSTMEDQSTESREGTLHSEGTVEQNETSQSTTTEEGTVNHAEAAQSTTEVTGTVGQDETSQSTVEEESGTITDEKVYQESTKDHSTIRHAEVGQSTQESTVNLDELSEGTTGEDGTSPGDDSQGTADEESTITQEDESQEVKEIGTPVLHQSTDEVVRDKESTIHDLAGFEDAKVDNDVQNLEVQPNSHNNCQLHQEIVQEIVTNNMALVEDCMNLICSNNSSETMQEQCKKVAISNNSSEPLQEQCKKLATCCSAQENAQELSATTDQCNKVATSNKRQETEEENTGKCIGLDQVCKTGQTSELNTTRHDNQVALTGIDNEAMLSREATSGSEPGSGEDTASASEDSKDYNDLEQSVNTELHSDDSCNSACTSEDKNLQTNTEQCEGTASQDTELLIDKEEIKHTTLPCTDTEQDSSGTSQFEDGSLQYEDTESNSARHSEDEDTQRSLEESRDAVVQSEDRYLQYDGPRLQTEDTGVQLADTALKVEDAVLQTCIVQAAVTLEDPTKETCETAEENVPELKKRQSLISSEDNSWVLPDRSAMSSKSEEFMVEKLLSIHRDTSDRNQPQETIHPIDSFECEMENIFENIPTDPVVPTNVNQVPETYHSVIACLETSTTITNSVQPETTARSTDNLKLPVVLFDGSRRTGRVANIAQTLSNNECNLEEHHSYVEEMCGSVAVSPEDLSSRDLVEELATICDEVPEDLLQMAVHTPPEVASPGNSLSAGECLVIYKDTDDFVILEEPEDVQDETVVQEDDRRGSDTDERGQFGTNPEATDEQVPETNAVMEQIIGESEDLAQELEVTLRPGTPDEDDIGAKLGVISSEQEIVTIRPEPDDKELIPVTADDEELTEKQETASTQTKLTEEKSNRTLNDSQPSENRVEISVNDTMKIEDSSTLQVEQTYHEVQLTADAVKMEQADAELQLVSEIEVAEVFLQDIKSEIEEDSSPEQELKIQDVETMGEFEVDVKEEVVSLEICAEEVQAEDEQEQLNVHLDLKEETATEEILDNEKNVEDQLMRNEVDVGPAVKDEEPEDLVKEELLPNDAVSDEKMKMEDNTSQKNDKEGPVRELEEGELSDESETVEAQKEIKADVMVIDDWDEAEDLLDSIQLQIPISQEKKLLFARRKKNLEKLKAKFLSAKQTQFDSNASLNQIQVPVIQITEECVQPSTAQSEPSKVPFPVVVTPPAGNIHPPEHGMPECNEDKVSCRRDSSGQSPKQTGRSINSASNITGIDQDLSANRSMNSIKFSPRTLTKLSGNVSFDSDVELFQLPTTSTKTKVYSKPSVVEATSSVEVVYLSSSSKPSSSSLGSRSSSRKPLCPSEDLSQCASARTSSKSDTVEATSDDAFQLPPASRSLRASVENKELFINPENPQYQPSVDSLVSRKRSVSYTDYSSLKIEFTAPKRRYSAMEAARPVRKPIINLDEISQNISQVLERLDSTEKLRYDEKVTYNQRRGSHERLESMDRARNEVRPVTGRQHKEKLVNQVEKEQCKPQRHDNHLNVAHTKLFYISKPSHRNQLTGANHGQKQESKKLDQFKLYEKMTQRKSQRVLPVNLYDDEESVLNEISGQMNTALDSRSTSEETTTSSTAGVLLSLEEQNMNMDNDLRLSGANISTPFILEDHKITNTGAQDKATGSVQGSTSMGQVDSAHQTSISQHSITRTAVKPTTHETTSSHRSVESAVDVTNVEDDPVKSLEGVASSRQPGDSARGATLVDPILVVPKVFFNAQTKRICGVKNDQAKLNVKLSANRKLCKDANKTEKSTEGRPGNASSKESSQKKLEEGKIKLEENKDGNRNVPHSKEDSETVTASQEEGQPKILRNQEHGKVKHKGRNEGSQTKIKRNDGKPKLETSNEDNQNLQASEEDNQKPQVTHEDCPIKCEGRKEDKTMVQGSKADSQMEVQRSREDNEKRNDNEMKRKAPEDEQMKIQTNEDKRMVIGTEEYIQTKPNTSSTCRSVSRTSQCDKKNSKIFRSGDNMVRDTVLISSTSIGKTIDVDKTTAKSSAELATTISSIPGTSKHLQDDSTRLPASSSCIEAIVSSIQARSSNTQAISSIVSTGPINIKGNLSTPAVEQSKTEANSPAAKQGRPESRWTSVNVKAGMVNMKCRKLNAIIAKLGSASLQAVRRVETVAEATHSSNIVSPAPGSLASIADRLSATTQRPADHLVPTVNQRTSSAGQPDSQSGPGAATVGQPVTPGEGHGSTVGQSTPGADHHVTTLGKRTSAVGQLASPADQHCTVADRHSAAVGQLIPPGHPVATVGGKIVPLADQHPVGQGCSSNVAPKITNSSSGTPTKVCTHSVASSSSAITASNVPRTGSSKVLAVCGSLQNIPSSISPSASAHNTSAANSTSCSVIVGPTAPKRRALDQRSNATDAKKPERIENKLANTFRLTEYTKSYIQLKMNQEVNTGTANGLKRSDPRLGHKPIGDGTQPLKRKLPVSEKEASVTAGLDKRVKINLQDYRNRKQHSNETKLEVDHHKNSGGVGKTSFDDCLGEVVNGIDDFMTVIETNDVPNEQFSVAEDIIGNLSSECLDLTTRSSNFGMEIYLDDSMDLIPGNEEIVHTSKQEDVPGEYQENSEPEELDEDASNESNSSQDRVKTNPTHCPAAGARKMRIRMICKPESAMDQARFEDISYPGPSRGVQARLEEDDGPVRIEGESSQECNEKIPLPKTAMVNPTKETIPTNINHVEPNVTNPLTRRRMKSKGEMKMYRPKRRKKRFRNLYTTDEDEESEVPTTLASDSSEILRYDSTIVRLKSAPSRVRPREEAEVIQDSPEDYSHLVSIEPAPYKCRTSTKKHLQRLEERQETNNSSSSGGPRDDLPQLTRHYHHRPHKRGKPKDNDDSPAIGSDLFSRKLEYKCHINLNALGSKCNMLADPVQPSTSKVGLKLTLKSVRKEKPTLALDSLNASPSRNTARRGKHGKRKALSSSSSRRGEQSAAYSVSTSAANRGWTVNDKVPKVIIKRNGSGYCAVSRDISTNPIWQPVIRVRRHRYLESLVVQGQGHSGP